MKHIPASAIVIVVMFKWKMLCQFKIDITGEDDRWGGVGGWQAGVDEYNNMLTVNMTTDTAVGSLDNILYICFILCLVNK